MHRLAFFVLLAACIVVAKRHVSVPPPPSPAPPLPQYICFQLPQQWCNTFNLSLEKYDSSGNGYYYGVDTSCLTDAPEDVMYGMFYQATNTYTVNFYWNMTSSSVAQSTVLWRQDSHKNWVDAFTWANRIDVMEEAIEGPDFYLTPRSVALQRC